MADLNAISIAIDAVDRTSGPVGAAVGSLGRLESAAGSVGGALVAMGEAAAKAALAVGAITFTAFVGGLASSVSAASSFSTEISNIGAVAGATAEQMKQISATALQLGKDTTFSAAQAAQGMEELLKAGVAIPDVLNGGAAAMLNLAAAGGVAVPQAATIMSTAMNTFKADGITAAQAADILAGAANASAIDIGDLGFSLSSVGAVAATMGVSLKDTATAIAVLGQAGLKGSDAGTSLKTMLLNLSPQTKQAGDEMRSLGLITGDTAKVTASLTDVLKGSSAGRAKLAELTKNGVIPSETDLYNAVKKLNPEVVAGTTSVTGYGVKIGALQDQFFDAQGAIKPMPEIFDTLSKAVAGMSKEQEINALKVLFGTDAIRASAIAARLSAGGFNEMADAMSHVTAADVAKTRLDNLHGSLEQLKGSVETASITFGLHLLPAIRSVVDFVTARVNTAIPILDTFGQRIEDAFAKNGPAIVAFGRSILAAGGYFANVVLYGDSLNDMLTEIPERFQGAAKGAGDFIAQLRSMAGTVATFMSGLNFGGIASGASSFLGGLVGAFQQIAPIAMTVGRSVVANITDTFNFLATRVLPPVVSMVQQIGAVLTRTLLPASAATGQTMRGIFGDTLDWLANTVFPPFLSIVEQTSNFFTGVILPTLPAVASALRQTLGETVQWLADTVWPKLTAAATVAWGYISTTIAPAIPGIAALIRDGLGKALEWIGTTGWPMLVSGATIAATFITGTLIPAVRDTISWLQEKLPPAIAGITTAWQAVRTTLTPIIQAVMSGDISSAIKGLGTAFSDFATLAGGWLRDQAAKIDWASVWGQTKDVLLSAASWFTDAATRFGTWLGEQAAQIDWSAVWSKATAVFETAVVWFANAATLIGGWIGDQVAAIDWASVWARAVNVVQGTAQWFVSIVTDWATWIGAQVAGIDWASVWAQAKDVILGMTQWFVGVSTQFGTWLGAQVAVIDWTSVWSQSKLTAQQIVGGISVNVGALDVELATWLNGQIAATNWESIGETLGKGLVGPFITGTQTAIDGIGPGLKPETLRKALTDFFTGVVVGAMADIGPVMQKAWDDMIGRLTPHRPNWLPPSMPWPFGPQPGSGMEFPAGPSNQGTTPATPNATSATSGNVMSLPTGGAVTNQSSKTEKIARAKQLALARGLDPELYAAQIMQESSFDPTANSGSARGIAQFTDATGQKYADRLGVSLDEMVNSSELSLQAGAMHMQDLTEQFGTQERALSAYYAGPGGGVHPEYVSAVHSRLPEVAGVSAASSPQTVPMSNQESTAGSGATVTYRDQWGNEFTASQESFDKRSKMPGGNSDVTVISRSQGQAAASAAGAQTAPKSVNMSSFGQSQKIGNQWELGLDYDAAAAACGPAAVALFMEATGRTPNRDEVMRISAKNGWRADRGMGGIDAFKGALSDEGVNAASIPIDQAGASAASGHLTAISTSGGPGHPLNEGHYFVAQGFDQNTGQFDLGETGGPDPTNPNAQHALKGGSRFMTMDQITALAGPVNGVIQLLDQVPAAATAAADSLPPVATGVQAVTDASTTAAPAVTATTDALTTVPPAAEAAGTGIDALGAGLFDIATAGPAAVVPATETITASFDTMAVGSLQSVTDLGAGVLTTTQDMAGNTVATITDMTGQVTSQSATLASGVSLNMADMGAQSTASVDAMTGNITTAVTDMAGNTITTVTTASGQVVSQFATMQTQAGSSVAQLAATSATEFGKISSAATSTKGPIEGVNTSLQSIKAPNVAPVLDALGSIETAAERAERAAKQLQQTVGGLGGEKGGGGKSPFGKAVGGSVFAGQAYLVGDGIGPEVFVPDTNGRIIPRISSIAPGSGALYMGQGGGQSSGTTITVNLHVEGSVMTEQDLVETVRAGLIDMGRRNGIDVLDGGN